MARENLQRRRLPLRIAQWAACRVPTNIRFRFGLFLFFFVENFYARKDKHDRFHRVIEATKHNKNKE